IHHEFFSNASSSGSEYDKTNYGAFLDVDPRYGKVVTLRTLQSQSFVPHNNQLKLLNYSTTFLLPFSRESFLPRFTCSV
ncbi:hypothetical protein HAX54_034703, partial [Datura stramonium]|nr:hypothetical protein [Datura stramonium]